MRISLSKEDALRLMSIAAMKVENLTNIDYFADLLTKCPDYVTGEMITEITSCGVSAGYAFASVLAGAFGLDVLGDDNDKKFFRDFTLPSIKQRQAEVYRRDPYYANIKVPKIKLGRWELKTSVYKPYEAFVCDDIVFHRNFKELPQLGFFDEEFTFPVVLEDGREWMSITPNEVETMRAGIAAAHGRAVTFGLGLGYYAYLASEKPEVAKMTIVERDLNVIKLFKEHILPQFAHKDKIEVINADAFEFAAGMKDYDFAYVDIWHDAADGVELYAKMKRIEPLAARTKFEYWIENSIVQNLRLEHFRRRS